MTFCYEYQLNQIILGTVKMHSTAINFFFHVELVLTENFLTASSIDEQWSADDQVIVSKSIGSKKSFAREHN